MYGCVNWSLALREEHTMFGYEVLGIILLRDLKGPMRLDRSKEMCVHVSTCTS
jgi:hypothetical protein